MSFKTTKKYKQHTENLRAVDAAFNEALRIARSAIRSGRSQLELSQTKLCGLMLGIWAETRLSKMLNEQRFFTDEERIHFFEMENLFERWDAVVSHGFRKSFKVKIISSRSLGHTAYHQYDTLQLYLKKHIKPILELRNRLAHGQWVYPFGSKDPDGEVNSKNYKVIKDMNIQALNLQYLILRYMSDLIFLLMAKRRSFQRDFDKLYSRIEDQVRRLDSCSYQDYKRKMNLPRIDGHQLTPGA